MSNVVKIQHEVLPKCFNEEMVLVDAKVYDISHDNRILIPFVSPKNKIGFYNRKHELVCEPTFDSIFGDCINEQDVIIVGRYRTTAYKWVTGEVVINKYLQYGVLDSTGKLIIEINYDRIYSNDDSSSFIICKGDKFGKMNRNGIITIPLGNLTKSCLYKVFHGNYWGGDKYGHFYTREARLFTNNGLEIDL